MQYGIIARGGFAPLPDKHTTRAFAYSELSLARARARSGDAGAD